MKPYTSGFVLLISVIFAQASQFQNLDFELAHVTELDRQRGYGSLADLLPGWQVTQGGELVTIVSLNIVAPDGPGGVALIDHAGPLVEGQYAITLRGTPQLSLVQRAEIPSDAEVLTLRYQLWPFHLSIDGANVPDVRGPDGRPAEFSSGAAIDAFDISEFAGKEVTLTLTSVIPLSAESASSLDSIAFVPEPSTTALLLAGLGGLVLLCYSRSPGVSVESASGR